MPGPALLLLLATLLPLVAAGVLLAVGRRLDAPLPGWVATFFAALGFGASLWALVLWCYPSGRHFHGAPWGIGVRPIEVFSGARSTGIGDPPQRSGWLDVGLHVDSLTIAMFAMMTLIAAIASAFAIGFMEGDANYARYFLFQSLLCFSVLGIVLGETLAVLTACWLLAGFCANRLIGFWNQSPGPRRGAVYSLLIQIVGNVLLFVGAIALVRRVGNIGLAHLTSLLAGATRGQGVALTGGGRIDGATMTAIGICLILGAAARAGQFPFHPWWGEATESPTPSGAMLHAGLFSASGIYLLARLFPILTPSAKLLLAIVGLATTVLASLIACTHRDLRRAISFAILAQFGLMAMGLGVGSWGGAVFHLIVVAFIGTLLLLAAGSVIRATGGRRELDQLGGLWNALPVTAATFAVGALALAGIPGFSAYYSHAAILANAGAFATLATQFGGRNGMYWCFFALPAAASCATAFALTRCWMRTFWGKRRDAEPGAAEARESSILWTPLLMLAVLSIFAGAVLGIPDLLRATIVESAPLMGTSGATPANSFDQAWPLSGPPAPRIDTGDTVADVPAEEFTPAAYALDHGQRLYHNWGRWAWAVGLLMGIGVYGRRLAPVAGLSRSIPIRALRQWLAAEMYFPETYEWLFGRTALLFAELAEHWGAARAPQRLVRVIHGLAGIGVRGRRPGGGVMRLMRRIRRSPSSNGNTIEDS